MSLHRHRPVDNLVDVPSLRDLGTLSHLVDRRARHSLNLGDLSLHHHRQDLDLVLVDLRDRHFCRRTSRAGLPPSSAFPTRTSTKTSMCFSTCLVTWLINGPFVDLRHRGQRRILDQVLGVVPIGVRGRAVTRSAALRSAPRCTPPPVGWSRGRRHGPTLPRPPSGGRPPPAHRIHHV